MTKKARNFIRSLKKKPSRQYPVNMRHVCWQCKHEMEAGSEKIHVLSPSDYQALFAVARAARQWHQTEKRPWGTMPTEWERAYIATRDALNALPEHIKAEIEK